MAASPVGKGPLVFSVCRGTRFGESMALAVVTIFRTAALKAWNGMTLGALAGRRAIYGRQADVQQL